MIGAGVVLVGVCETPEESGGSAPGDFRLRAGFVVVVGVGVVVVTAACTYYQYESDIKVEYWSAIPE